MPTDRTARRVGGLVALGALFAQTLMCGSWDTCELASDYMDALHCEGFAWFNDISKCQNDHLSRCVAECVVKYRPTCDELNRSRVGVEVNSPKHFVDFYGCLSPLLALMHSRASAS